MRNIYEMTKYTLKEAFSRKIFLVFFGVSSFILILFIIFFLFSNINSMTSMVKMNGKENIDLVAKIIEGIKAIIVAPLFGIGLFLSVFSASSFIPNLLEKGSVELFLSKPVSRRQIIWGKFWGGTIVVFVNVAFLIIGVWLLIGLKFGVWDLSFLTTIFTITFTFGVLYGLIILVGILTQSSLLAMMITYLIFFILSPVLASRDKLELLIHNKIVNWFIDGLYYLIPKTSEMATYTVNLAIGKYNGIELQPFLSSFLFMILTLYIGIIIFNKKDY